MSQLILANVVLRNCAGGVVETNPQIGLLSLAKVAKNAGHEVNYFSGENLVTKISCEVKSKDTVVGFYCNSDNIIEVQRTALEVKKRTGAIVIVGGPHATALPEETISFAGFDVLLHGEGEHTILELLGGLPFDRESLKKIRGLCYIENGSIINTGKRPPIEDLDTLPPVDYFQFNIGQIQSGINIVTGRGCGFNCSFCFESIDRKPRCNSAERVISDIKFYVNNTRARYFAFADDCFVTSPARLRAICEGLKEIREKTPIWWYCEARVDILSKNKDLLPMMREAGCVRLQIGSESGDQKVIDLYNKQITVEQVIDVVKQCAEVKMPSVFTNFIIGGAGETIDSLEKTEKLIDELFSIAPGRFECLAGLLAAYPKTQILEDPKKYSLEILDQKFLTSTSDSYLFAHSSHLTRDLILATRNKLMEKISHYTAHGLLKLANDDIFELLTLRTVGFSTSTVTALLADEVYQCWYNAWVSGNYLKEIPTELFGKASSDDKIIPFRTIDIRKVISGKFFWQSRNKLLEFKDTEFRLLELASGKLSLSQISDILSKEYGADYDEVYEAAFDYYNQLAKEHALLFRIFE